jgi:membrane protease YdiL (CAAX protease family)
VRAEAAALVFALTFPTAMAWLYFVAVSPAEPADTAANPALQALYAAGKVVQFGFPVVYLWLRDRTALKPSRPSVQGVRLGLAFGLLTALAMWWLYRTWLAGSPLLGATPARLRAKVAQFGLDTPAGFLALAAFLSVAHSFLEEWYWRGFAFARLRRLLPVGAAVAVSALGFMSHHVVVLGVFFPGRFWTAAVPLSLCIAVGGAAWAWVYERSGSLVGPWLSHLVVDAAIMAVGYDLLFRAAPSG